MQGKKTGRSLITFQDSGSTGDTENHSELIQLDDHHHQTLAKSLPASCIPTYHPYVMGSARCCLGTACTFPLKALSSQEPLEFSTWVVFIQLSDSAQA